MGQGCSRGALAAAAPLEPGAAASAAVAAAAAAAARSGTLTTRLGDCRVVPSKLATAEPVSHSLGEDWEASNAPSPSLGGTCAAPRITAQTELLSTKSNASASSSRSLGTEAAPEDALPDEVSASALKLAPSAGVSTPDADGSLSDGTASVAAVASAVACDSEDAAASSLLAGSALQRPCAGGEDLPPTQTSPGSSAPLFTHSSEDPSDTAGSRAATAAAQAAEGRPASEPEAQAEAHTGVGEGADSAAGATDGGQ